MEEEVEAEVEGQFGVGGELEIFLISEGDGIGHVSKTLYRINVYLFIVEVKLKRMRWRFGRRGGCLTPAGSGMVRIFGNLSKMVP